MPVVRQRLTMSEESRPALSRYAKLRFDGVRQRWVILAPERVLAPDDIAVEVLQLCDGDRTVMQVIDILAETYTADRAEIASDVLSMLRALAEKGFLIEGRES
ncbi:pyrroloquinoline quinone biosynthesis peptide chaperone PqqD [Bradyrhizobium tropiciagri]|uniref:pyrroloquinoline quinone biosynthesis peptide chaperone PqqD n=1 Tax=Bradyrhizobium tropiciagri TaxID=312253 RepID=UPI001BADDC93|nr:pyrroloquinoline quinone biosynthesis peptide chaperone PqqD [Bradyrhizobium tropiciagri]MBR0898834.1 pyrroloquinoline quinone biosynthesis peptide chaperone PqqD [Bradyrhizobium tropiciagri]